MIPNTRSDLSDAARRVFANCFDRTPLSSDAEEHGLFVAAMAQADSFRTDPDVAGASAEERFTYAQGLCRIVRHDERSAIDDGPSEQTIRRAIDIPTARLAAAIRGVGEHDE